MNSLLFLLSFIITESQSIFKSILLFYSKSNVFHSESDQIFIELFLYFILWYFSSNLHFIKQIKYLTYIRIDINLMDINLMDNKFFIVWVIQWFHGNWKLNERSEPISRDSSISQKKKWFSNSSKFLEKQKFSEKWILAKKK